MRLPCYQVLEDFTKVTRWQRIRSVNAKRLGLRESSTAFRPRPRFAPDSSTITRFVPLCLFPETP